MKQLISFFLIAFFLAGTVWAGAETKAPLVESDIAPGQHPGYSTAETSKEISPKTETIDTTSALQSNTDPKDLSVENASAESEIAPVASKSNAEVVILRDPENLSSYLLAPGDALEITVWKEEGLQQQQFLIGPDGNIIYPLIGNVTAAGRTINDLKELLTAKLADFIADPSISVKLINNQGNIVFVIGKVNKPGQVVSGRRIDVLQALSLAGGLTVFADDSNITIQRRIGDKIEVFPFDYSEVINGEDLEQNILLEPGDTIAVP